LVVERNAVEEVTTGGCEVLSVISIIIPTLDEERALPETLESLKSQEGTFEVIVADGGSDDGTVEIVRSVSVTGHLVRCVQAPRGRARQMNAGAVAAGGEWLMFLHADTRLPADAVSRIMALPSDVRAGCFHQLFNTRSRFLRLLSWAHNQRFRVTRVIYGDQAMFVRRELFDQVGGFPDQPMEDVAISLKLRRRTKPIMLPGTVLTDARKFEQMGSWRALRHSINLLLKFRRGADVSGDSFFDDYR
jgi:rSAM/selenodomain-associated transferase 2